MRDKWWSDSGRKRDTCGQMVVKYARVNTECILMGRKAVQRTAAGGPKNSPSLLLAVELTSLAVQADQFSVVDVWPFGRLC